MKKKFQVSIPEPCHEDWDKMKPVDKGKFCDSCQKQVVDFSNMSDFEMVQFFKKPSAGSLCGKFASNQLGRDIRIPKKRIPWVKYFFQIMLPAFLTTAKATAQGKPRIDVVVCNSAEKNVTLMGKMANPALYGMPMTIKNDKLRKVVGIVTDENGKAISGASVLVKAGKVNAITNSAGGFTLLVKANDVLVVSAIGFDTKEIKLPKSGTLEIVLNETVSTLKGDIVFFSGMINMQQEPQKKRHQ